MRGAIQSESMLPAMLFSMLVLPLASATGVHRALSGDEEARTDRVEYLTGLNPKSPEEPEDVVTESYGMALVNLGITVAIIGGALIFLSFLWNLIHCCRRCCCKCSCCACVDTCTKGKGGRYRLLLLATLLGLAASMTSFSHGEQTLQAGVKNVADGLSSLSDLLNHLDDVIGDMAGATADMTSAVHDVTCSGGELDEFMDEIRAVNDTIYDVSGIFGDMHEPVDNAEDAVREHGRRWVAIVIPAAVAAPFSLYLVLALLGVCGSRFSKTAGGCCLNLGSAWAGGPGLGVALVIFAVLFVVSIAIADVCWLGPAAVLTQDNEDNKYIAYYLNCEGENPLDVDVSATRRARCSGGSSWRGATARSPPRSSGRPSTPRRRSSTST